MRFSTAVKRFGNIRFYTGKQDPGEWDPRAAYIVHTEFSDRQVYHPCWEQIAALTGLRWEIINYAVIAFYK